MLEGYTHEYKPYNLNSGLLHWLHIVTSNAKAFILGIYHGLPEETFNPIWTSTVSALAAAILAPLFWSAWPWLLAIPFG